MVATDVIFYVVILIFSVVLHEVAHGFVAEYWGDPTARLDGRLTLNPVKHLDMFGSVILPILLIISKAPFLLGWAKPVPFNPNNFKDYKWGTISVALAGVLTNLFIALVFGLVIRLTITMGLPVAFYSILSMIVLTNLVLFIFNLVPIPPLDGSKVLFSLLPLSAQGLIDFLERYALILLLIFVVFFVDLLYPILTFLYTLITGLAF